MAGSGDVSIDSVGGKLNVKTGSGDLTVTSAGRTVDAVAGSGDVLVKRVEQGSLRMKTGSGDVSVGVATGTAAYLDIMTVTGDVSSDLDASDAPSDGDADGRHQHQVREWRCGPSALLSGAPGRRRRPRTTATRP